MIPESVLKVLQTMGIDPEASHIDIDSLKPAPLSIPIIEPIQYMQFSESQQAYTKATKYISPSLADKFRTTECPQKFIIENFYIFEKEGEKRKQAFENGDALEQSFLKTLKFKHNEDILATDKKTPIAKLRAIKSGEDLAMLLMQYLKDKYNFYTEEGDERVEVGQTMVHNGIKGIADLIISVDNGKILIIDIKWTKTEVSKNAFGEFAWNTDPNSKFFLKNQFSKKAQVIMYTELVKNLYKTEDIEFIFLVVKDDANYTSINEVANFIKVQYSELQHFVLFEELQEIRDNIQQRIDTIINSPIYKPNIKECIKCRAVECTKKLIFNEINI